MALVAWGVGTVIALCGALTFAELGRRYPHTGGQYQIVRDAYGPVAGFVYVFSTATVIMCGSLVIIAIICVRHLAAAAGHDEIHPVVEIGLSALLIIGLTGANAIRVRCGAGIQNVTVLVKLLTLAVVIAVAVTAGPPPLEAAAGVVSEGAAGGAAADQSIVGLMGAIFAALVPAFFAFGGWQQALWVGGEIRNPRVNLPLAIIGGVLLVGVVYMLANWAYLHLLGYEGVVQSRTLAADAVSTIWPGAGARVIAAAVAVSAFGVLNAGLLTAPRLVHGMAADGRFFPVFARVSPRFATPLPAIVLLGTISLALLILFAVGQNAVDRLLTCVVFLDGIFFVLTGIALFLLRRRPGGEPPARYALYPVAPLIFILGEIAIVTGACLDPSVRSGVLIGLAWIALAIGLYVILFRTRD